jgi:hypothetical protein
MLGVKVGQGRCDLEGITNLTPIPSMLLVLSELLRCKLHHFLIEYFHWLIICPLATLRLNHPQPFDVHFPDILSLFKVEWGVIQLEMYARLEGFIQGAGAVGGQEEEAVVVFEDAKEDYII